jgi:CRP/FNR family transcriptional regulator, cyclic AMP receptor protein
MSFARVTPIDERTAFADFFRRVSIFRELPERALADVAARATIKHRVAGAVIVAQDEPADAFYVLHSGRARVALFGENGREVTLNQLRPGDYFGEVALLDGRPRSANVVAVTDVTVLMLDRESLLAHLRAYPDTALRLLGDMSRRLRHADEMIGNLALLDVYGRLARTLVSLAREEGTEPNTDGVVLRLRPTQQELAHMVGTCRETVSRAVSSLTRQGLLSNRGRGMILAPRLVAMARARAVS